MRLTENRINALAEDALLALWLILLGISTHVPGWLGLFLAVVATIVGMASLWGAIKFTKLSMKEEDDGE